MQKTKKQLLGFAGLVIIAAMTLVACAIPSPDAAALGEAEYADESEEPIDVETNVDVKVVVNEGVARVSFITPTNDSVTTDAIIPVSFSYEEVNRVELYLTYQDENGATQRVNLEEFAPTEAAGTHTFNLDVSRYGYRDFQLHAVAYGNNGATRDDTVAFSYKAVSSSVEEKPSENGDPVIGIEVTDDVERIEVQIYDEKGNPMFIDKDGKKTPLIIDRKDIDANGKLRISLPFEEYGIAPGNYTGVITAYGKDDNIISMNTFEIKYAPATPETPNTGSTLFKDLNISRLDYILTGLLAFGVVAGFALYLFFRKERR